MKKLITIILILALILPTAALADSYIPKLEIGISGFITKYNSLPAALNSPFLALKEPYQWTEWGEYQVAWFYPTEDHHTTIVLITADPRGRTLSSGLDMIQIFSASDWVQLLSVTNRCSQLFSNEYMGMNLAPYCIADIVSYAYENNCLNAYRQLDSENKFLISYFRDGMDYFQISSAEGQQ
jgi:hypothetical protein